MVVVPRRRHLGVLIRTKSVVRVDVAVSSVRTVLRVSATVRMTIHLRLITFCRSSPHKVSTVMFMTTYGRGVSSYALDACFLGRVIACPKPAHVHSKKQLQIPLNNTELFGDWKNTTKVPTKWNTASCIIPFMR